ncbi:MAG: hypothetical protein KKG59_00480 [Nanoarchaeota archaeon]|nr:hypothetical protein [Nanoarchaeota archaeon]
MGLTNKKEEQLKKMPRIESRIFLSKNGKYIVQRTTFSSIKPVEYYKKVIENGEIDPKITLEDFDDSGFFQQDGAQLAES